MWSVALAWPSDLICFGSPSSHPNQTRLPGPWAGKLVAIVTAGGEASHLSPTPEWRLLSNLCCSGCTAACAPFLHTPLPRLGLEAHTFLRRCSIAPCLWFIWCVYAMCVCSSLSLSLCVSQLNIPHLSQTAPCLWFIRVHMCYEHDLHVCECHRHTHKHIRFDGLLSTTIFTLGELLPEFISIVALLFS